MVSSVIIDTRIHESDTLLIQQNGDDTPLYDTSMALMTFQQAYGLFPRILGKGDGAQVSIYLPAPATESSSLTIA